MPSKETTCTAFIRGHRGSNQGHPHLERTLFQPSYRDELTIKVTYQKRLTSLQETIPTSPFERHTIKNI